MIEYIFVDQPRIDMYAEQIADPVKHGRKMVWSASVDLLGPKLKVAQELTSRDRTNAEKVEQVVRFLRQKHLISEGRSSIHRDEEEIEFYEETIRAHRCTIPNNNGHLAIWVATDRKRHDGQTFSNLFLIEDFRGRDDWAHTYSSYSSFRLLLDELHSDEPKAIKRLRDIENAGLRTETDFVKDPVAALSQLGAAFGPSRTVKTLYRVRASCADRSTPGDWEFITIGYPILIWGS
jgi:hypothetical protein